MHAPDLAVFAAYLVALPVIAACCRTRARTGAEFYLAGRSLRWLPVGLSVMVTAFSGINFVAFPGAVFRHGLGVLVCLPLFVVVAWPVSRWVIPALRRAPVTSVYELLERRRGVWARSAASGIFILWRLLWMATALIATGRFLAAVWTLDRRPCPADPCLSSVGMPTLSEYS